MRANGNTSIQSLFGIPPNDRYPSLSCKDKDWFELNDFNGSVHVLSFFPFFIVQKYKLVFDALSKMSHCVEMLILNLFGEFEMIFNVHWMIPLALWQSNIVSFKVTLYLEMMVNTVVCSVIVIDEELKDDETWTDKIVANILSPNHDNPDVVKFKPYFVDKDFIFPLVLSTHSDNSVDDRETLCCA